MRRRYPAAFIRGGTSKALVFHARDLPADRAEWDEIFLKAMGTPDRYGRQLNGMTNALSQLQEQGILEEDPALVATFAERQALVHKDVFDELNQRYGA